MTTTQENIAAAAKNYVQHAAHLVNVGSHFMSTGQDNQAMGAFKRALDILQQVASNYDEDQPCPDRDGMEDDLVAIPFVCEDGQKILLGTPEEEDKSCFFVYSQPLVFDMQALDLSCTPVYLAIVIFDMTLLLLRRARNEEIKASFFKALRLYDLALDLLRGAPDHVDASNVMLALMNNKIHTCYCVFDFEEAHTVLEEFAEVLPMAWDGVSTFEDSELNGMILNTLLPLDPTRLAPAA